MKSDARVKKPTRASKAVLETYWTAGDLFNQWTRKYTLTLYGASLGLGMKNSGNCFG